MALSRFCGPDDVITPVSQQEEVDRKALGGRTAQNYKVPFRYHTRSQKFLAILKGRERHYDHEPASLIKSRLEPHVWAEYFKFCFERNPYDKAISDYYWRDGSTDLNSYFDSANSARLSNWSIYTINDHVAVDYVARYENLEQELETLRRKLDLPEAITLTRAKGRHRVDRKPFHEVLPPSARTRIELVCAKELRTFKYSWPGC